MKILVVDDDAAVRQAVRVTCEAEGHVVAELDSGEHVVAELQRLTPDVMLLDISLPGSSGFEVCREVRAAGLVTPLIFLSGKSDEIDVVLGLEIGADDYVAKPFRPRELLARIHANARKRTTAEIGDGERLVFRGLTIDLGSRRVEREGQEIDLTHTEFDLLAFLASQVGHAVSREEILHGVWSQPHRIETRVIDVHVRNLRRKLEIDPAHPRFVLSVPGVGYRLAAARP
jgi:two-component system response regulator MtrA